MLDASQRTDGALVTSASELSPSNSCHESEEGEEVHKQTEEVERDHMKNGFES